MSLSSTSCVWNSPMLQREIKFKPENSPGRGITMNWNTPKVKKKRGGFSFEKVEGGWSWCTLYSSVMQFDVRELVLSKGSIFNSKSRWNKDSWAPGRHIFLHSQFCCGLTLSGISKDMISVCGWWHLSKLFVSIWERNVFPWAVGQLGFRICSTRA